MPNTITEEKILKMVKIFGTIQEGQLEKILGLQSSRIRRTVNRLWKKDMLKFGGPDGAYLTHKRNADEVDILFVDCIWVLLAHTDKEEDILTAFRGGDVIKLTYFSREKQSSYNFVYVSDEEDYKYIPYINSRYLDLTDKKMINNMKFIFVSDSRMILEKIPLEKFKFPSICMQIEYEEGRSKAPTIRQIVQKKRGLPWMI